MRNPPKKNWAGEHVGLQLTAAATPTAGIDLLLSADAYPLAVATMPYAGCARLFDGLSEAGRVERYISLMVAPASRHARAALTQCHGFTIGTPPYANEMWTTTGGSGSSAIITVSDQGPLYNSAAMERTFGFSPAFQSLVVTGDTIDDTPAATKNRQLELAVLNYPAVEQVFVTNTASFSVCIADRVDLESL